MSHPALREALLVSIVSIAVPAFAQPPKKPASRRPLQPAAKPATPATHQ